MSIDQARHTLSAGRRATTAEGKTPSHASRVASCRPLRRAGAAVGVSAGGLITAAVGWQWVFFLTVPVTVLGFVCAPLLSVGPTGARARRSFDVWGAISVTGGAHAPVYPTLSIAEQGWFSIQAVGGAVVGVGLLVCFVVIDRHAADPIVPLALFRDRTVSAGVVVGLLGGAARVSTFFSAPCTSSRCWRSNRARPASQCFPLRSRDSCCPCFTCPGSFAGWAPRAR